MHWAVLEALTLQCDIGRFMIRRIGVDSERRGSRKGRNRHRRGRVFEFQRASRTNPKCHDRYVLGAGVEKHLGFESKSMASWDLLPRNRPGERRWGLRLPTTSKSMARKRPHPIPIEDTVVDRVIERGRGDSWRLWWEAFQAEGDYLEERATKLHAEIGRPDISTLRVSL